MKEKRRIFLYGNSVILGSVGASLQRGSQFEVTVLEPPLQDMQELDSLKPEIVLFDLETIYANSVFPLLKNNPNLLLIGISPDINLVKIWFGRQVRELSTQSLLELIKSEANDLSFKSGSDEDRPYRSVENE